MADNLSVHESPGVWFVSETRGRVTIDPHDRKLILKECAGQFVLAPPRRPILYRCRYSFLARPALRRNNGYRSQGWFVVFASASAGRVHCRIGVCCDQIGIAVLFSATGQARMPRKPRDQSSKNTLDLKPRLRLKRLNCRARRVQLMVIGSRHFPQMRRAQKFVCTWSAKTSLASCQSKTTFAALLRLKVVLNENPKP